MFSVEYKSKNTERLDELAAMLMSMDEEMAQIIWSNIEGAIPSIEAEVNSNLKGGKVRITARGSGKDVTVEIDGEITEEWGTDNTLNAVTMAQQRVLDLMNGMM